MTRQRPNSQGCHTPCAEFKSANIRNRSLAERLHLISKYYVQILWLIIWWTNIWLILKKTYNWAWTLSLTLNEDMNLFDNPLSTVWRLSIRLKSDSPNFEVFSSFWASRIMVSLRRITGRALCGRDLENYGLEMRKNMGQFKKASKWARK